ncbi:hypothetical protein CS542_05095 [Pedobacter sp. IW39]|nr:hypothetical protein CS542_05095 [Pedobacter sp. IW39]
MNQQNFNTESRSSDLASEQVIYDMNEQDIIDHIEGNNVDVSMTTPPMRIWKLYSLNNYSQSDLSSAL